jgi:drug/metabolite transporter (DMT)-like permease
LAHGWPQATFRIGWSAFWIAALVGLAASTGLLLFGYTADLGLISVTSILASLYPAVTILLANLFLGERLSGAQVVGVPLAFIGVALVSGV